LTQLGLAQVPVSLHWCLFWQLEKQVLLELSQA
jgi:hypothetical protein